MNKGVTNVCGELGLDLQIKGNVALFCKCLCTIRPPGYEFDFVRLSILDNMPKVMFKPPPGTPGKAW